MPKPTENKAFRTTMKKSKGSIFEYEHQRNRDLMRAYREAVSSPLHSKKPRLQEDIFQIMSEMPSERFWVSEERAAIVVSAIMNGDRLEKMGKMKREMFLEIYKRVMELRECNPQMYIYDLVSKVCCQQAPKFYLTPKSIKVIMCKIRNKWYEKRKQKLQHLS